jgi:hypothetical protein
MAVEDPVTMDVTCDDCGESMSMDTTSFSGDPVTYGVTAETIEENGWTEDGGETFCPKCANKREGEE